MTSTMNPGEIWQTVLNELQWQIPKPTFETWVKGTQVISVEGDTFVIGVRSAYARDWLEHRLRTVIARTLTGVVGRPVAVNFVVYENGRIQSSPSNPGEEEAVTASPWAQRLNPRYTFETFVVGPSNRLAHAAALAVAERPAQTYNPLFIYGGVGLGKTHLLHAIGHVCLRKGLRVLYVSSEEFTNDLINAIRAQTTDQFRDKYRSIDVLLIDDIQFIAGKESTQEEFFHTFNTLHSNGKQLVISSDRPPRALVTLEERLRSRFEWGLIADIQPPDLETRIAILRAKAEGLAVPVPDDVIEFIARQIQSNIRELEGALNRVVAYAQLMGLPLTMEVATSALADLLPRRKSISIERIIEVVADFYGVPADALRGPRRNKELVYPRQVAMYLAREEIGASLPQIGEAFGGRDHTTVLYGIEKVQSELEHNERLRREIMALRERLYKEERP